MKQHLIYKVDDNLPPSPSDDFYQKHIIIALYGACCDYSVPNDKIM